MGGLGPWRATSWAPLGVALALLVGACGGPSHAPGDPVAVAPPAPPVPGEALAGAVRVTLSVPRPSAHLVEVETTFPVDGAAGEAVELRMASWTPGSYLIRDYAGRVEAIAAVGADGAPRAVTQIAKDRWQVTVDGAPAITVRHRVWAHEASVRNAWVDTDLGMFVGAALFVQPVVSAPLAYDVSLVVPEGWDTVATGLDPHPEAAGASPITRWVARDWDELIDTPIVAGKGTVRDFTVRGVPHQLATFGADARWDHDQAAADLSELVEATASFWGVIPYDHYVFLNVVGRGGGGLEHLDSTLMMTGQASARSEGAWKRWLGLCSHEHFHAWNVKRLRPAALGPFDYAREVPVHSLWVAEGLTSYYDDLMLVRAGLITPDEHLGRLSGTLGSHQRRHGRLVQSLSGASFEAWTKYYGSADGKTENQISYYDKGSLAGWLIDARIRACSGGHRSLDDAMRLAWDRYSGDVGYTEAQWRDAVVEVAGCDLRPWLDALVDGTEELDLTPALTWWGLRLAEDEPADPPEVWLGLDDGVHVSRVPRGSPAFEAGVELGDELIALDGERIVNGGLAGVLAKRDAGDAVALTVARRGRLETLHAVLAAKPTDTWRLEVDPEAGRDALRRREAWWMAPPAADDE